MKTPRFFRAFEMPRRSFLKLAAVTTSSFAALRLPAQDAERKPPIGDGKLRIIVFGAHPDDCGLSALLSGISALREGELRVRLDEERDALLTIKRGEHPWPDVNAWRLRLHKEFHEAFASTHLPERPDYSWANEFLLKARREMV